MKHLTGALMVGSAALALTACDLETTADMTQANENTGEAAPTLSIPFEKFTLDNGLDVVLHQDRSDPVVAIDIAAHVGSARELPGRTGFAHLFEHLLFLDSENLGYSGLDELNTRIGGTTVNGFTTNDMTQYYQTAPSDGLEKIVWAEAEKLGFFIKTVSADALANEKQVVKNEKRQGVDNQPYGHTRIIVAETLYPEDHPYSWSVIGSLEDLDAASLDDVVAFYKRWYVPNNVTLTIAGDFEIDEAKAYVEKYFAEIPQGDDIPPLEPRASELPETIRLYHEDNFARVPQLTVSWPTVEQFHPDAYALDILTTYLSEGKKAPLNEVLVDEEKLTSSVGMYNYSRELAGETALIVTANAGTDLDEVKPAVLEAFDRFAENGISEKDLTRIKAGIEVDFYGDLEDTVGKATALAEYNLFTGDPGFVSTDIERTLAVTAEDVMRVFETYIADKPHVVISMVPKGQLDLMLDGSTIASITEEEIVPGEGAPVDFDPTARTFEPTPSAIDRSEPPYGPAVDLPTPEVWQTSLANGIEAYGIETTEIPLVTFSLRLDAGRDRASVDKVAVPALTADLLTKGTATKSVAELEEALELLGASVSVNAGAFSTEVRGETLARNLDETVALVTEVLTSPRWDPEEFELMKLSVAQGLDLQAANPNAIAGRVSATLAYPEDHVLHYPTYGTKEQLETITLDDLKTFYTENYAPAGAVLRVAGDVTEEEVAEAFAAMADAWTGEVSPAPELAPAADIDASSVYFYDIPGAKQSILQVVRPSIPATHPDYPMVEAMNYFLGGNFTSELNNELRVNKGYTYGARSRFAGGEDRGTFGVYTSVRTNATYESLELIRDILSGYGPSFDEERLDALKSSLLRRQALETETLGAKLGVLENISVYDYPTDYLTVNAERLKGLSLEEFTRLTETYIRPEAMNYVVVGDAETQAERLDALGFGEPIMVPSFD